MKIFRVKIIFVVSILSFMTACTPNEEVWTGEDKNPIQVVCGKSCKTILFRPDSARLSSEERYQINQFVYQAHRRQRIFVSPCVTNDALPELNEARINIVMQQIKNLGYTPIKLKPTMPADLTTKRCINLVKGKLSLYVQNCPNTTVPPSTNTIGSDFGCTSNYNFAQMVINPWNLLALPGDNGTEGDRVAIGIKNYREGKLSKLDVESSS